MKKKDWYTWHKNDIRKEVNTLPSLTVPDQTMSISELVQNSVRSVNAKVYNGRYHDEETIDSEDGINPATLDLVDFQQAFEEIEETTKIEGDRIAEKKKQEQKEKLDQEKSELIKKWETDWLQSKKSTDDQK